MSNIIFLVIGILIGYWLGGRRAQGSPLLGVNQTRRENKEEDFSKILATAKEKGSISNSDVEELLGVSDSTATRYLDELEKQGKLTQIGETGKHVIYRPTF